MLTISTSYAILGGIGFTALGFALALIVLAVVTRENDNAAMGKS